MRKIILASRSKARKRLLKQIGLKFEAVPSGIKEKRALKGSIEKLVKDNALAKAKDVASRIKSGIVIGADTAVMAGNKLIGKPKNLKDAAKTLRILSTKPQWVYSGIAVVDAASGKALTGSEKTLIYMSRISGREIKNYFRKVSPLDKAGSFDIQGHGSVFIDRIEGCFYNVVGLPLAKLAKLLKKMDKDIL